jgi:hypothetical protein
MEPIARCGLDVLLRPCHRPRRAEPGLGLVLGLADATRVSRRRGGVQRDLVVVVGPLGRTMRLFGVDGLGTGAAGKFATLVGEATRIAAGSTRRPGRRRLDRGRRGGGFRRCRAAPGSRSPGTGRSDGRRGRCLVSGRRLVRARVDRRSLCDRHRHGSGHRRHEALIRRRAVAEPSRSERCLRTGGGAGSQRGQHGVDAA